MSAESGVMHDISMGPGPMAPEADSRRKLALALGTALALSGGYYLLVRPLLAERITAASSHTVAFPSSDATASFDRQKSPDVDYRVVLEGVPPGGRLSLNCEWVDPAGAVVRRNQYRTRFIYKWTWPTHCHQRFGPDAAAGQWQVRMLMGGRVLSSTTFDVR